MDKVIEKPASQPKRSYATVGRPALSFEEKGSEGKRVEARKVLDNAGTDSCLAIYKAAKLKADDEGHGDSAYVLSKIYENPIENGAMIRSAMEATENERM